MAVLILILLNIVVREGIVFGKYIFKRLQSWIGQFFIIKLMIFYLNIEEGLWYTTEPNKLYIDLWALIIWFAIGICKYNQKKINIVFNSMHNSQLWIMNFHKFTTKLYIRKPTKHDNIRDCLIRLKNVCYQEIYYI